MKSIAMALRSSILCLLLSLFMLPVAARGEVASFHGVPCTKDCSGHKAGYAWAQKKGITSPQQCGGSSRSFIAGCRIWVAEHHAPSDAHSVDKNVSMPLPGK